MPSLFMRTFLSSSALHWAIFKLKRQVFAKKADFLRSLWLIPVQQVWSWYSHTFSSCKLLYQFPFSLEFSMLFCFMQYKIWSNGLIFKSFNQLWEQGHWKSNKPWSNKEELTCFSLYTPCSHKKSNLKYLKKLIQHWLQYIFIEVVCCFCFQIYFGLCLGQIAFIYTECPNIKVFPPISWLPRKGKKQKPSLLGMSID